MNRRKLVAIAYLMFASVPALGTDTVILHDGSRIVGTIDQLFQGKLVIVTDFAGKLEIETAKVKSISSDRRMNVALTSGDRLVGPMTSSEEAAQSTMTTAVGAVSVGVPQMSALWPEGKDDPIAMAEIDKYKPKWGASIDGGIFAAEGNSDFLNANARAEVWRKTSDDLLKFYALASYGEQDDIRNRNEYIAGARYENLISARWYWYVRSELEYDEFENLDLRATVAGGAGYYWLKKPNHELKTFGGLGYRHQSFMDGRNTDDPILDLGLDYRLDIGKYAQFTHSTLYGPSLEEFRDYRLTFDTALAIPFKSDLWRFKLGMRNDYNSDPDPGRDDLDNLYYATIGVTLK